MIFRLDKMLAVSTIILALSGQSFALPATASSVDYGKASEFSKIAAHFKNLKPDQELAVLDGNKLTVKQLDDMVATMNPNFARLPIEQRRLVALQLYVDRYALSKAAAEKGLTKTPEFNYLMQIAAQTVLQKLFFQKEVLDKITEAEIKARYRKEVQALPKEEEVHARHILVKTKAEAEALIARLNKGENFEKLAKKSSTDGSAAVGGDLGYFGHGQMVQPFEKAAFALKVGSYTRQPVETPFGWHIIKLEDRRQKQPPKLEEIKEAIRNMIARDHYQEILIKLLPSLNIKFKDKQLGDIVFNNLKGEAMKGAKAK